MVCKSQAFLSASLFTSLWWGPEAQLLWSSPVSSAVKPNRGRCILHHRGAANPPCQQDFFYFILFYFALAVRAAQLCRSSTCLLLFPALLHHLIDKSSAHLTRPQPSGPICMLAANETLRRNWGLRLLPSVTGCSNIWSGMATGAKALNYRLEIHNSFKEENW